MVAMLSAVCYLEAGIHRVMPCNFAFKTIYIYMVSIDFGESELSDSPSRNS
jgi:hypothetical protein